ncbi:MAG: hypothetical protein R8K20_01915 [Gallionellaceae bacterium]
MSLTFERWYPFIFAVAAFALAWMNEATLPLSESYRAGLLSAAISASAIFVGFVATSKSILMALPVEGIRQRLHDSGFIEDLAQYLNQAMVGSLIFCVLNIIGFFPVSQQYIFWFTPIWIGGGIFCIASFWRIGRVMTAILRLK